MIDRSEWKSVPPPDHVQVPVAELMSLWQDRARLSALMQAGVEQWQGYAYAQWLHDNDPDIRDIRLGEQKAKG